jgi:hypothetical protein
MGDRGNIGIRSNEGKDTVWFYTHWRGSEIADVARKALAKRWRWNCPDYLARIVFDVLTDGEQGMETGCGIGVQPGDNSYAFLVIDCDKQAVYREADSRPGFNILPKNDADLAPVPFEEFIKPR